MPELESLRPIEIMVIGSQQLRLLDEMIPSSDVNTGLCIFAYQHDRFIDIPADAVTVSDSRFGLSGDGHIYVKKGTSFDYEDAANPNGQISITFTISMGGQITTHTVDITITDVDESPVTTTPNIIYGTESNNWLHGRDGADIIYGRGGDDWLLGYAADDVLHGGDGDDKLFGENGDDKLYGGSGDDELYGDNGNDDLDGGDGDDKLRGELGDDELFGGDGDDELHGGYDNDILNGGKGSDTLYGGEGDDKLKGGIGDTMTGGKGDDLFHLKVHVGGDDTAVVTDFAQGEDQLKLAGRAKKVFLHAHEDGVLVTADRAGTKTFAVLEGFSTTLTQADFVNQGLNIIDFTEAETTILEIV